MSFAASSHKLAMCWGLCGSAQSRKVTSSAGSLPALVSPQPPLVPSSARAAPCPPGGWCLTPRRRHLLCSGGLSYCINENKVLSSPAQCSNGKICWLFSVLPSKTDVFVNSKRVLTGDQFIFVSLATKATLCHHVHLLWQCVG